MRTGYPDGLIIAQTIIEKDALQEQKDADDFRVFRKPGRLGSEL